MLISKFGGASEKLYVDDVFSAYLRTGTAADVTVTTGIDMTQGYCLHTKGRSGATDHAVYHSARGVTKDLATNSTAAETTQTTGLKSVSSAGHTIGSLAKMNTSAATYIDWVFRNADKFYNHDVVTKSAGSNATINFANLGVLGMVRVKRTDSSGSWYVWHRSLMAGKLLIGETTAAETTLGHITVSGTTVTLVNGVIADGTYLVEAWAHDTSPDGLIQCGIASGTAEVTTGWEPQFVETKRTDAVEDWFVWDSMRGLTVAGSNDQTLRPNTSGVETTDGAIGISATGFACNLTGSWIFIAIRRPNKPPTSGTEVYNAQTRVGDDTASRIITGVGFAPDLINRCLRNTSGGFYSWDRLRGKEKQLSMSATTAEADGSGYGVSEFQNDGYKQGSSDGVYWNSSSNTVIDHFFRRAPGVHDHLPYNGSGANKAEAHTLLGVQPELWFAKRRNGTGPFVIGSTLLNANEKIICPSPNGRVTDATAWNSTYPTATQISLGALTDVNASGGTYIIWMWATLAGVSKVGKITGNGSSQNIECGFSAGARFVMIIRMTAGTAQDIYIFDTVRGIVSGNDPHLSLNTTAAEVTTDDSIDPYAGGFAVNQNAATNINVNGAEYLFLAYA